MSDVVDRAGVFRDMLNNIDSVLLTSPSTRESSIPSPHPTSKILWHLSFQNQVPAQQ